MPTIEVSRTDLLQAVAQLSPQELEAFVADVLALRADLTAGGASETDLLRRIRHSLPDDVRRRFRELNGKRRADTLTPDEHAELLRLIDQVENSDAERVRALAQLARLRKKSLAEVMQELGIQAPPYE
jgi:hypothetical protein